MPPSFHKPSLKPVLALATKWKHLEFSTLQIPPLKFRPFWQTCRAVFSRQSFSDGGSLLAKADKPGSDDKKMTLLHALFRPWNSHLLETVAFAPEKQPRKNRAKNTTVGFLSVPRCAIIAV